MQFLTLSKEDIAKVRAELIGKVCGNKCNATGVLFDGTEFIDCECVTEFKRRVLFLNAGIPKRYHDFTLDNLTEEFRRTNKKALDFVVHYYNNLQEMLQNGIGLFIQGKSGLAKSALGYYILKGALQQNYVAYAIKMSSLTKLIYEALEKQEAYDMLAFLRQDVQFLMIDEIEKDYKTSDTSTYGGTQVNEFFSSIYDMEKPLIVTSNVTKNGLRGIQAENLVDRFSELVDIVLTGESYRKPENAIKRLLSE